MYIATTRRERQGNKIVNKVGGQIKNERFVTVFLSCSGSVRKLLNKEETSPRDISDSL